MDRTLRSAMRRLGSRGSVLNRCPVCGQGVTPSHDRETAWPGTYVHRGCAEYEPRRAATKRRFSPRVHARFTGR